MVLENNLQYFFELNNMYHDEFWLGNDSNRFTSTLFLISRLAMTSFSNSAFIIKKLPLVTKSPNHLLYYISWYCSLVL